MMRVQRQRFTVLGTLSLLLGLPAVAPAAQETEVMGTLHGELGFTYETASTRNRLYEHARKVGEMYQGEVDAGLSVRFGVAPGIEAYGVIPYQTRGYRNYGEVSSVCGDGANLPEATIVNEDLGLACTPGSAVTYYPDDLTPVYVPNPAAISVPDYTFGGLDTIELGLRFSPLHEQDLSRGSKLRPFPPMVTWRLDGAVLVNPGSNFYEQGAGTGASGVRFGTSFSKRLRVAEPYMAFRTQRYGTFTTTTLTEDGATQVVELDPANLSVLMFGVELIPYENGESQSRFTVDFGAGTRMWGKSTVISGYVLPSVTTTADDVDGTRGEVVTQEAHVDLMSRLSLNYNIFKYMRIQATGNLGYGIPYRLESPYEIITGRTVITEINLQAMARF